MEVGTSVIHPVASTSHVAVGLRPEKAVIHKLISKFWWLRKRNLNLRDPIPYYTGKIWT